MNADNCTPMNADDRLKILFMSSKATLQLDVPLSAAIGVHLSAFIGVFKDLR